jgi:hypothetical protein
MGKNARMSYTNTKQFVLSDNTLFKIRKVVHEFMNDLSY